MRVLRIQAGDRTRHRAEIHRLRCEVLDLIVQLVDLPRSSTMIKVEEREKGDERQRTPSPTNRRPPPKSEEVCDRTSTSPSKRKVDLLVTCLSQRKELPLLASSVLRLTQREDNSDQVQIVLS